MLSFECKTYPNTTVGKCNYSTTIAKLRITLKSFSKELAFVIVSKS